MSSGLVAGFLLDRQWHWLRGEMEESKRPALLALGRVLRDSQIPYAINEGLAVQVHQREPRTTLDIDVAVIARDTIPRDALLAAGFRFHESFRHSENWSQPAAHRSSSPMTRCSRGRLLLPKRSSSKT